MGVAGLIFEPRPPNFENQYNFWRCLNGIKTFFDISISFRFSKISVECTLHSEAPPCPIPQSSYWSGTFFCCFLQQTGSRSNSFKMQASIWIEWRNTDTEKMYRFCRFIYYVAQHVSNSFPSSHKPSPLTSCNRILFPVFKNLVFIIIFYSVSVFLISLRLNVNHFL